MVSIILNIKSIFKKFLSKIKFLLKKFLNHESLVRDPYSNVYYWNPKRLVIKKKILVSNPFLIKFFGKRVNNFGDLIGPIIVKKILSEKNKKAKFIHKTNKLLTVGSIMHFAKENDHIWGTGINGKVKNYFDFNNLNIYSVRGPLTRDILLSRGFEVPEIYGDPGLLLGHYFPQYLNLEKKRKYLIIPNLNDKEFYKNNLGIKVSQPTANLNKIILDIAQSEIIISSSLHGIVLADAFGIDSIILKSKHEDLFKYKDYLLGTGRNEFSFVENIEDALESNPIAKLKMDFLKIIGSFPYHLYK